MIFKNQRLFHTKGITEGDYTCGFFSGGSFKSFMLEDTKQEGKIAGQTRIPADTYELKIRKEDSPLTIKHRAKYKGSWFDKNPNWYHIEITGIPNFKYVYLHAGNDDSHTLGCNLPCYSFDISKRDMQGGSSIAAVNDFYAIAYPLLEKGVRCYIQIVDENE